MTTQPEPKLTQVVIEAISRQKRLFLAVFLAILILTALLILFIPKRYDATAQLIVENLRPKSSLSTQPVDKVVMSEDVTETQINSEVELLHSQSVLRKALGLAPVSPDADVKQLTAEQTELKQLQNRLAIDPIRLSSIIDVKLTQATPQDAIDKLNAIFNAYFEERANLTHSSGAAEFFEQQTADFSNKLDENRRRLSDFEIAHELVDMNDQKKIVVTRIATLDDHIADARARLANQAGRTRQLRQKLEQTPPRSETTRRSLTNQYSQEHLQTALVDLQNHRTELLHRYSPTDRAIVELDEKIETTRSAIQESGLHPAAENASDVNPIWGQIESLLLTASAEISGTAAEQEELLTQKHAAEARLRELLNSTGTYEDLSRRFTEVQNNYNLYAQKRDEAKIGEALDSQKMFNVSLVQRPIATLEPTRPKPIPYALAGLVLALCLASIIALAADRASERVYSPMQLDGITHTQTIATIPDEDAPVHGHSEIEAGPGGVMEYRKLLNALRAALARPASSVQGAGQGHCVAFTSAIEGEGVSTVARNVAQEAARQAPQKIALLDMDLLSAMAGSGLPARISLRRDPATFVWTVDAAAHSRSKPAVTDPIAEHDATPEPDPIHTGDEGLIDLGDLHGDRFWVGLDKLLDRAREEFSLTLLDCPSLRASTLAGELDGDVDGFVVIVAAGIARQRQVEQAGALMQQSGTPLIGYVLNRRTYPVPAWLYDMFW